MAAADVHRRNCARKPAYCTRALARRAARMSQNRSRKRIRAYRCPACGLYHLTSNKPSGPGEKP